MVNLWLFYADYTELAIEAAYEEQRIAEAATRAQALWHGYTGILTAQCMGPLRQIVIPEGDGRHSRYSLMKRFLKDPDAAKEVGFDELRQHLYSGSWQDALEDLPLDFLLAAIAGGGGNGG